MKSLVPVELIENKILLIRGEKVMLDSDLAEMYGVATKVLLQAVKRNINRFPSDFMFQLDNQEVAALRSQIVTSKTGRGGRRYLPYVFTEQGVAIECILAMMGINRSVLLPTINYENRDPKCDLDYVPNEARQVEHRVALSNSFGFGGQNACLVVGKFDG